MEKNKTKGTSENDDSPYKKELCDKMLKWISFLNQQTSVQQIVAHHTIVSNHKKTFGKLTTRYVNKNPMLNFFMVNHVCFIVYLQIKDINFSLYLFEDDTIEVNYKTKSIKNKNRLVMQFPYNKIHKGWKKIWRTVQESNNSEKYNLHNLAIVLSLFI